MQWRCLISSEMLNNVFTAGMRSRRTASREELRVPRGDVASFEPGVRLLGVKSRGNGSGAVVTLVPVCLNGSLSSNANVPISLFDLDPNVNIMCLDYHECNNGCPELLV